MACVNGKGACPFGIRKGGECRTRRLMRNCQLFPLTRVFTENAVPLLSIYEMEV
jgi:hypothetical protein